jgi:Zn-dependent protease with chaperone function
VIAAVLLVLYAVVVGTFGARVLARARWMSRAPLLGIATYLAAAWSVLAALALAGLSLAVRATSIAGGLSDAIGACVRRLRELYATPGGAMFAALGLALAGFLATRVLIAATRQRRADLRRSLWHAHTARLVGRPAPALKALVVEDPRPAAYCVAGRSPSVIVTSGAVAALSARELDAVLRHERAHLAGRHHRLKAAAHVGRQVLPFLPLHRDAELQVTRLVELHADDTAIRAADPTALATALVAQATPAPALAAAATDAVQRIHRLLGPVEPLGRTRRHVLRATAAAFALAPAVVALAPALVRSRWAGFPSRSEAAANASAALISICASVLCAMPSNTPDRPGSGRSQ